MNVLYKLRGNILSDWSTKNPVLAEREPAIVMIPADSGSGLNEPSVMLKIGDGITAFNDLDYVAAIIDWNAAEGEPGHILNKPFGIETTPDIVFTAEDIANPIERFEPSDDGVMAYVKVSDRVFTADELDGMSVTYIPGDDMTESVTDNNPFIDKEHTILPTGMIFSSSIDGTAIGVVIEQETAPGDDIAFSTGLWLIAYGANAPTKILSVTIPGKETIKQLDSKFLNPALQFGETTVKGDTLTWDGNTEGRLIANDAFVKISDAVVTANDCKNGCKYSVAGEEFSFSNVDDGMLDNALTLGDGAFVCTSIDNLSLEGFVFPETGVYVPIAYAEYAPLTLTIPGYAGFETKTVTLIDPKFLPEEYMRTLTSPNGTKFRLSVNDDGTLSAVEVTE